MVLSGNEALTSFNIHARVVDGSVAELQLVGFCSSWQPYDLCPVADSHNWDLRLHQTPCGVDGIGVDSGVTGAVGNNDSVWIHSKNLVGWIVVGDADNAYPS